MTQRRWAEFRFRLRERFLYAYDFNDHWPHDIRVEQMLAAAANRAYPLCLGGKRAAPPQDCGGVEAY
jgi:Plasmid pRiA4b ORF-3-like protein